VSAVPAAPELRDVQCVPDLMAKQTIVLRIGHACSNSGVQPCVLAPRHPPGRSQATVPDDSTFSSSIQSSFYVTPFHRGIHFSQATFM